MFVVFGATGFIGRAVQAALQARRAPYIGFGSSVCIRSDGTGPVQAELSIHAERASLLRKLPKPVAILFAAGTAVTSTEAKILRASHLGSLETAIQMVPRAWWEGSRFVYTSSCTVYERLSGPRRLLESDPVASHSAYAEIKLLCEAFLSESIGDTGICPVTARLFNVSGFGQRAGIVTEIAQQAIELKAGLRRTFNLRTNEPILDVIDVDEAATALLALAEVPAAPPVVNVCSGRPVTTEDLVVAARRAVGCDAPVTYAVDTDRRQMLVGNPDLMSASTGWRALRNVDDIMAAVISGTNLTGAAS